MKRLWARVGQDENTELRALTSRVMQDTAGDEFAERVEVQDIKSRELNLVIKGIPYHQNEDTSNAVFDYVLKRMQLVPKAKFRAFRLGRGSHRRSPMMVQFQDVSHSRALASRRLVMHNKYKMKGTSIKIFPDLTSNQRQALPLEKMKVQKAREQGLWCELREGVATDPTPMRKQVLTGMNKDQHVKDLPEQEKMKVRKAREQELWCELREGVATDPTQMRKQVLTGMDKDQHVKDLPEHLVEKIIAMMPFPSIFKARCLSKSWLVRFSPVTSVHDEENKGLAISFQKLVGESSDNWKIFWPIKNWTVGLDRASWKTPWNGRCFAYDRERQKCQQPPSSLLKNGASMSWYNLEIDGAVVHGLVGPNTGHRTEIQVFVGNILTRSWKLLPPIPDAKADHGLHVTWKKLVSHTLSEYKMLLLCLETKLGFEATPRLNNLSHQVLHVYDSNSCSWISEINFVADHNFMFHCNKVYLNGVLYIADYYQPEYVLALDVGNGTVENLKLSTIMREHLYTQVGDLAVCKDSLLLITTCTHRDDNRVRGHNCVLIDVASGRFSEVATVPGPSSGYYGYVLNFRAAISDGQFIFLVREANEVDEFWVQVCNVKLDEWSGIVLHSYPDPFEPEWTYLPFQPGLNKFLAV